VSDVEQRAAARKTGLPRRGHNRRRDFLEMREAFQWQILGDNIVRGIDAKVALAISLYLNREDWELHSKLHAWPGIDTIAQKIGVSERSVRRSIGRLVMLGHFRLHVGGRGPGDPHHYIPQIKGRYTWPVDTLQ
jgi:hypothetical protein